MDSERFSALAHVTVKRFLTLSALIVALAVLAYAVLIVRNVSPYIGGSDSSGYLNSAKLLGAGRLTAELKRIPDLNVGRELNNWLYIPLGFAETNGGKMVPTYPVGLPLTLVALSKVVGWENVTGWAAGLHMFFGAILMYGLSRECGLSPPWAWFGALVLGTSPLYVSMGLQLMSDVPAMTWCTAAVYFALLSRRHAAWAGLAGVAVAVAVLVRPSDVLIILPVALVLGLDLKRWFWLGVCGLPGAVFQCIYNLKTYGGPLTTGYGDMRANFRLMWVSPTLLHYLHWLPLLFTPLILASVG